MDVSGVGHALSRLTLLGRKLCGFDLPLAEIARQIRRTDPGDDVVMDGCKPKKHVYAAEERSNLSFEATALGRTCASLPRYVR
jgi:hypothetical protein